MGYFSDRREKRQREAEQAAQKAWGEAQLRAGNIQPIDTGLALDPGEEAYCKFNALFRAAMEEVTSYTSGTTKSSGTIGRAIIGGALFGSTGAIVGAVGAPQHSKSATKSVTTYEVLTVDQGYIVLTNKRFIFVGQSVFSVPYTILLSVEFRNTSIVFDYRIPKRHRELVALYDGMPRGMCFVIDDGESAELCYQALYRKLSGES